MRIIEPGKSTFDSPSAITIGKFDGVHLGHRALLSRTRDLAAEIGGQAGVVTFDRHPMEVLRPGSAPPYLTPLMERLSLLDSAGMDFCVLLRLEDGVLGWPAAKFVEDVIVRTSHAIHVITGEDFRYGHDRTGDIPSLTAAGIAAGFAVHVVDPVQVEGARVSSYAIRNALTAGNLPLAEAMLGRRYEVAGAVEQGKQIGRTIGFPTANVKYDPQIVVPKEGIYAVTVDWGEGERAAAASLGRRPTVEKEDAPIWLEVFVLDWSGDLYGKWLRVTFVQRLRDELRFDSLDHLQAQIEQDVETVRSVLG
ncbi:MAG TPA: bifunctional riboflavin kinase/FAD synthetase [Armatimonadota bacterium]